MFTSDPVADYARYDRERSRREQSLPLCAFCGHTREPVRLVPMGAKEVPICTGCLWDRYGNYADNAEGPALCDECGRQVKHGGQMFCFAGETWCRDCIENLETIREEL